MSKLSSMATHETASCKQSDLQHSKSSDVHLVFVYGTLRRGHKNQYVMTEHENGQAIYVGQARTIEKYPLVIGTKFNIPFVLNKPGYGHNIFGDIYRVDNKMLKHLDWFEDCPAWYQRRKIYVNVIGNQHSSSSIPSNHHDDTVVSGKLECIECWGYLLENFKEDLERQKYFADYNDAVKEYDYEKEMEDAEENFLEYVTSETLDS